MPGDLPIEQARPCSCPARDKLARGRQDKGHAMPAIAQTAIGAIGIDIGKNSFHIVGLDDRGQCFFPRRPSVLRECKWIYLILSLRVSSCSVAAALRVKAATMR